MKSALWIYRRLLRAFPHEFKVAYGEEVSQLGEQAANQLSRGRGGAGVMRLWADAAIRLPVEYLSEMRFDIKYALRGMLRSPGFAMAGIISLGFGMGLATLIYSTKWQLISRPLPASANAQRLVMPSKPVSYYFIEQLRAHTGLFAGVAALETGVPFNVKLPGDNGQKSHRIFGQLVSPDYFSVLGVLPQRGRLLNPELEKPGDAPAVVISDRFWRNRLNASPDTVGQTLRLNGQLATIVGVAPPGFNGALPVNPSELFVPLTVPAALAPELANDVVHQHQARDFLAIICLRPGITIQSAESALDAITRNLDKLDAPAARQEVPAGRVQLLFAGGMVPLPRNLKPAVAGFFGVLIGLILILACMNLASLVLARASRRRKELAIRISVGASRFRLVRQIVSEGVLLSLLGGIAGFALAYGLAVLKSRFTWPGMIPQESVLLPDWGAAVFVLAMAVLSGIGFSLAPALRATKSDLTPALKQGLTHGFPGFLRFGLRNLLLVAQFAASSTLLLITGFLVIGINETGKVQTRFDARGMCLVSIDPVRDGYAPEKARALVGRITEILKSAPVSNVAVAADIPFAPLDEDSSLPLTAEGPAGKPLMQISAFEETVGAGYFAALSEPLMAGRGFTEQDERAPAGGMQALPVVLNASAARGFFSEGDPVGKRIQDDQHTFDVVGVVADLRAGSESHLPVVYLPLTQGNFARPPAGGLVVMVRASPRGARIDAIRRAIDGVDPNLTVIELQTLEEFLARSRAYERFSADTYGGVGLFSLVLAAVGLAGVTAYSVAQRRKEIAIRRALGASRGQVLRLVLNEGATIAGIGTVLGFLGAFAISRLLSAVTNVVVEALRVGTSDSLLLLVVPLLLCGSAMVACYVPARRAARIDPLRALREE